MKCLKLGAIPKLVQLLVSNYSSERHHSEVTLYTNILSSSNLMNFANVLAMILALLSINKEIFKYLLCDLSE